MRLLLDEMISPQVAVQLRSRGIDIYGIAERADLVQLTDAQVLALAGEEQRVVVTFDIADVAALARADIDHSGILFVSSTTFPQDRALLGALVSALQAAVRSGALPGPGASAFLTRQA